MKYLTLETFPYRLDEMQKYNKISKNQEKRCAKGLHNYKEELIKNKDGHFSTKLKCTCGKVFLKKK